MLSLWEFTYPFLPLFKVVTPSGKFKPLLTQTKAGHRKLVKHRWRVIPNEQKGRERKSLQRLSEMLCGEILCLT